MKAVAMVLVCVMSLAFAGCAQKSASEQLKDDMNSAAKKLNKDMNALLK